MFLLLVPKTLCITLVSVLPFSLKAEGVDPFLMGWKLLPWGGSGWSNQGKEMCRHSWHWVELAGVTIPCIKCQAGSHMTLSPSLSTGFCFDPACMTQKCCSKSTPKIVAAGCQNLGAGWKAGVKSGTGWEDVGDVFPLRNNPFSFSLLFLNIFCGGRSPIFPAPSIPISWGEFYCLIFVLKTQRRKKRSEEEYTECRLVPTNCWLLSLLCEGEWSRRG